MTKTFDALIIGSGIIGSCLGSALSTLPAKYSIGLVDLTDVLRLGTNDDKSSDVSRIKNDESRAKHAQSISDNSSDESSHVQRNTPIRYSSLTNSSLNYLSSLNSLSANHHAYSLIRVWENPEHSLTFNTRASICDNHSIHSAILSTLKHQHRQTELFNKTTIKSISLAPSAWPTITLTSGKTISTRLLIGADGQNSIVRQAMNVQSIGWDYHKQGVVAIVNCSTPITAWQRFLKHGPIALLPINDKQCSIVWTVDQAVAKNLVNMDPDRFVILLNAAVNCGQADVDYLIENHNTPDINFQSEYEWALERANQRNASSAKLNPPVITSVSLTSRASFPLKMRNSQRYYGHRVVLVGDAAHTIHPLAGQGLNMGFKDVECLSRIIHEAAANGDDFGMLLMLDYHYTGLEYVLENYARERYAGNLAMIASVDALERIYGLPGASGIRGLGMSLLNSLDGVKERIQRFAS